MRYLRPLLAALFGLSVLTLTVPAWATPGDPSGFGLAPSKPQPGGVGYFVENVAPGQTVTDSVTVTYAGPAARTLAVQAVDGRTADETGTAYSANGPAPTGAGRWVAVQRPTFDLAPNSRQTLPFTITVPADATPGDHVAGIAFQDPDASVRHSGALSVRTLHRSVVGVLVHVAGPAIRAMTVDAVTLGTLPGFETAGLHIRFRNTGRLLVKPRLEATLQGPGGYHRTVTRQLDTVLPPDAVNYPLPWPDSLAAGPYQVHITLTADGMNPALLNTQVHLGDPVAGSTTQNGPHGTAHATTPAAESTPARWAPVAAAIAGVGLAVLLGLAALRRRAGRRRARRGRHAGGPARPVAPGDDWIHQPEGQHAR